MEKTTPQSTPHKRKPTAEVRLHRPLRAMIIAFGIITSFVFAAIALYPAGRDYYLQTLKVNQLQGELQAVQDRNDQISSRIAVLQTPEGIQDRAREQLGMVMNGETAVNITGLSTTASSTALPREVTRGLVVEEASWWSDFLNYFFAVPEAEEPAQLDDPFGTNDTGGD